ncbi:MAG: hypothetical protein HYU52_18475 [Acidobacteria bacterium]|nr:hypothetical protein [Acidobacteriota bacterium]
MRTLLTIVLLAAVAAAACSRSETDLPAAPAKGTSQAGPHGGTDPGIGEMTQSASSPSEIAILYELPAGWTRVKPTGKLRLDQASISGPGGDAELVVFFFGVGGGGGVDANLDMWAELVEGGTPVRSSFEQGVFKVSCIDAAGTVIPSGMTGARQPIPNGRLLGAVVEGPGGPWFFKVTGPDATVAAQKDAFLGMLRAVRLRRG